MLSKIVDAIAAKYEAHHAAINFALLISIVMMIVAGGLWRQSAIDRELALKAQCDTANARAAAIATDFARYKTWVATQSKVDKTDLQNFTRDSLRQVEYMSTLAAEVAARANEMVTDAKSGTERAAQPALAASAAELSQVCEMLRRRAELFVRTFGDEDYFPHSRNSSASEHMEMVRRERTWQIADWLLVLYSLSLVIAGLGFAVVWRDRRRLQSLLRASERGLTPR